MAAVPPKINTAVCHAYQCYSCIITLVCHAYQCYSCIITLVCHAYQCYFKNLSTFPLKNLSKKHSLYFCQLRAGGSYFVFKSACSWLPLLRNLIETETQPQYWSPITAIHSITRMRSCFACKLASLSKVRLGQRHIKGACGLFLHTFPFMLKPRREAVNIVLKVLHSLMRRSSSSDCMFLIRLGIRDE